MLKTVLVIMALNGSVFEPTAAIRMTSAHECQARTFSTPTKKAICVAPRNVQMIQTDPNDESSIQLAVLTDEQVDTFGYTVEFGGRTGVK